MKYEAMLWGLGFGGEIQLKITHSLWVDIYLCIKPGFNKFFRISPSPTSLFSLYLKSRHCLSVYIWAGSHKGQNIDIK